MDGYEYSELLKKLDVKIGNIALMIKPEQIRERLGEIEDRSERGTERREARHADRTKRLKISSILTKFNKAKSSLNDAREIYDLPLSEGDEETIGDSFAAAGELEDEISI